MKNSILILTIVLSILLAGFFYYSQNKHENIAPSLVSENDKTEIIVSKLNIYDLVTSKKYAEVKDMMLDFNSYYKNEVEKELINSNDTSRKEYLTEELGLIEESTKNLEAEDAVVVGQQVYDMYIEQYGSREDFERDLYDLRTTFTKVSDTHVTITLPDKKSGINLDMRTLEAYFVSDTWY